MLGEETRPLAASPPASALVVDERRRLDGTQALLRGLGLIGAVLVVWQIQTWISWGLAGPHQISWYRPTHHGTAWWAARAYEAGAVVIAMIVASYVGRRCIRERRLTGDAVICISTAGAFWLDPAANWLQPVWMYSSQWVNLNAVTPHMFLTPDPVQNLPEPILFLGLTYAFGILAMVMAVNAAMRAAHTRWPGISVLGLIGVAFGFGWVVDFALELPMFHFGLWGMRAPGWMRVFGSGVKGEPLAEVVFAGIVFSGLGCLRYFRDDQGRMLIERSTLKGWRYTAATVLAGLALTNLMVIFGDTGDVLVGMYAGHTNPAAIAQDLRNGNCGPGSAYGTCPGEPGYVLRLQTPRSIDGRHVTGCPSWMNGLACEDLSRLSLSQLRARAALAQVTHPRALDRKDLILALS